MGENEFTNMIETIMSIPDEQCNEKTIKLFKGAIDGMLTNDLREKFYEGAITEWKNKGVVNYQIEEEIQNIKDEMDVLMDDLNPSKEKRELLQYIFDMLIDIYKEAYNRFNSPDIILPMTIGEGAKIPSYAHPTDAGADLYAAETITLEPHSLSNKIASNVCIALPQGWMAMIIPRSSIGAKTGLRLSNSMGCIDSNYRGPLGILYDNISDSPYTINAGDRIAQLLVFPSYHFQPQVVETLDETDRNEGGFGSTGK